MQACQALLVEIDPPQAVEIARQLLHLGGGSADADVLHGDRIDGDGASRFSATTAAIGVDGNIVHPHLVFHEDGGGDGRVHGVAPEEHLALTLRCRRLGRLLRRWRGIPRAR